MKKSLLFGAAIAVAFAGNAKEAVHVAHNNAQAVASELKLADRYTNVGMISADRQLNKEQIKAAKKSLKASTDGPIAYYERPSGTYFVGMSPETASLTKGFLLLPAYAEQTWTNASLGATSSLWEYCSGIDFNAGEGGEYTFAQSADNQIVTPKYEAGYSYPAPYLQASTANADSVFTVTDYLDTDPYIYLEQNNRYFYSTNLRPDADVIAYLGATIFNDETANGLVDSKYGFSEAGYSDVKLNGVAELYRKPAKPYLLSAIAAHFYDIAQGAAPANVKATIYPVTLDEDGYVASMGEPLYEGAGDSETMFKAGRQWQTVLWDNVTATDPVTGRPSDLIVDQDILIVIEPTDDTTKLAQYLWASNKAFVFEDINNTLDTNVSSYLVASATNADGESGIYALPYSGAWYMDDARTTVGALKSWPIQILAKTYYLDSDETTFVAETEVESSKTFAINSWYSYEEWTVYAEDSNGEEVDWIEYSAENVMDGDAFTGVVNATFTVQPLPEGVTGREATIEISYLGATLNIHVQQGESGVKGVEVKSAQYVNVVGNDFVVKATSDVTKAEVYTAAGVKVAEAAVNGTATINAAGLAHGVYFVKLNNGKTVKVVK